ncbi:MAG: DNA repair protein RadA, partial [Bacteroidales bacterium]|nr:DNA repair protein RadA [Bacteroidales bacterium]
MAKTKSIFFCQNCGNESTKWVGKCPACGEWNTYVEEVVSKTQSRDKSIPSVSTRKDNKPQRIQDIQ